MLIPLLVFASVKANEPVWTEKEGKIYKDGEIFVESGLGMPITGVLGGQNGSVIVAQPTELTQIFDEDGDGKGDFFRALIGNFPSGNRIVSGPIAGSGGEIFVGVLHGGKSIDLFSWDAVEHRPRLVFAMPNTAAHLTMNSENVLAAIISDSEGDWIGVAKLPKGKPDSDSEDEGESGEIIPAPPEGSEPIQAVPVAEPQTPILKPAIRLPKMLIGEGVSVTGLAFSSEGGFEVTTSDEKVLKVTSELIAGNIQGSAIPQPKMEDQFSVQAVELVTDGFEITLSKPINRGVAGIEPIPFQILSGLLVGGSEMDHVTIKNAVVEPDGLTLNLIPDILLPERVYIFDLSALKSEDGEALKSEKAAYTVISIPDSTIEPPKIEGPISDATVKPPEPKVPEETE